MSHHHQVFHIGQIKEVSPEERARKKKILRGFLRFIGIWLLIHLVTACLIVARRFSEAVTWHLSAVSFWIYGERRKGKRKA